MYRLRLYCACAKYHPNLFIDSVSAHRMPLSDCAYAQTDLGLWFSHFPEDTFSPGAAQICIDWHLTLQWHKWIRIKWHSRKRWLIWPVSLLQHLSFSSAFFPPLVKFVIFFRPSKVVEVILVPRLKWGYTMRLVSFSSSCVRCFQEQLLWILFLSLLLMLSAICSRKKSPRTSSAVNSFIFLGIIEPILMS